MKRLDFSGSAVINDYDRLALVAELAVVLKRYAVSKDDYALSTVESAVDSDEVSA